MSTNAYWPDAQLEFVKERWAEGHSATQIARQMRAKWPELPRSRSAVLGKVHRLKLAQRTTTSQPVRSSAPHLVKSKPKLKPRPAPVEGEDPGPADPPITTMDLKDHHCKWPYDVGNTFHYCGGVQEPGKPYCLRHCAKVYQPPKTSAA
jgi:GcrA cell cycle regulator